MQGIENLNILSLGGFIFFLLIFLIGYIFVEILFGKSYFFRRNFERYENHLFDRIIHYIAWGMILNILFLYLNIFWGILKNLADLFNISGKLANTLGFLGEVKDLQFIFFSIQYFFILLIFLTFIIKLKIIIKKSFTFFDIIFDKIKDCLKK